MWNSLKLYLCGKYVSLMKLTNLIKSNCTNQSQSSTKQVSSVIMPLHAYNMMIMLMFMYIKHNNRLCLVCVLKYYHHLSTFFINKYVWRWVVKNTCIRTQCFYLLRYIINICFVFQFECYEQLTLQNLSAEFGIYISGFGYKIYKLKLTRVCCPHLLCLLNAFLNLSTSRI